MPTFFPVCICEAIWNGLASRMRLLTAGVQTFDDAVDCLGGVLRVQRPEYQMPGRALPRHCPELLQRIRLRNGQCTAISVFRFSALYHGLFLWS
jgi:hypothetical protein